MKFEQPAYPTSYFSKRIWVHCPKCEAPALVSTETPENTLPYPGKSRSVCHCRHCGFQAEAKGDWAGFVQGFVRQACGHCGSTICHTTPPVKESYPTTDLPCEVCMQTRTYNINWYPYRNEKPTDPYFGYELYLQTQIKDHLLWVYNPEHLQYLREYVMAKLRTDDDRNKYSMIANLPQWVKSAKNRELIIRKLDKLEREFTSHSLKK